MQQQYFLQLNLIHYGEMHSPSKSKQTLLVAPHTACSVLQAGSSLCSEFVSEMPHQVLKKIPCLRDQAHSCMLTDRHNFRKQKKKVHE